VKRRSHLEDLDIDVWMTLTRILHNMNVLGLAIAIVVSRWLPTAAARVRSRVWSSGICGGQSTIGQKWPQYKGLSPTPLAIKKI
jgi:hypothetical protein